MKNTLIYMYVYVATQTPRELGDIILAVIIISLTLNVLLISVLILIVVVFIKTRRKSGRVCHALHPVIINTMYYIL